MDPVCPVGPGLAGPRRPGRAPPDHHRPGRALLLSHPLTVRSDLDPIDDYCNEHGLPPLAVVCVYRKTGEPSRGNVAVFRLDKNRERVFNYD